MNAPTLAQPKPRPPRPARPRTPSEAGLPDPRPLAEYTVTVSVVGGNTHINIVLDQPCVIRTPNWALIDNNTGARVYPAGVTVVDNRTFFFTYTGLLPVSIGTIEVPYQDMQVQNFQGGFVRPGGQWFRKAS